MRVRGRAFIIISPLLLALARVSLCPSQILSSRADAPSPSYLPFLDRLAGTVRDDIAECAAVAYKSLPLQAAVKMMKLAGPPALSAYIADKGLSWVVEGEVVRFEGGEGGKKPEVDALTLVHNTVTYATELERIV
jgi:26S proteasome regulatory subunit N12